MKQVRDLSYKGFYLLGLCTIAGLLLFGYFLLQQYQVLSETNAQEDPTNPYIIEQKINGQWTEVHRAVYETEYTTKEFSLVSNSSDVQIRLQRVGGDFADVEQITLEACGQRVVPQRAIYLESGDDVLADILEDDLNVIIAQDKLIELEYMISGACFNDLQLSVKANAYSHASPFYWVQQGGQTLRYTMDSRIESPLIDGEIDEVDGVRDADYQTLWEPVTGHPDGITYAYLSNDAENLYVSLDVTMDNTNEEAQDYAEIIINGKTYRVDDANTEYGLCGFGITSKVSYKHQYCEFAIPRNELESGTIRFKVRYYGTGGGPVTINNFNALVSPDLSDDVVGITQLDTGSFDTLARSYDLGSTSEGVLSSSNSGDETLFVTNSSGSEVFIGWGQDITSTGSWNLYVSKVTTGVVASWTTNLEMCGGLPNTHCVNNIRALVPDTSGGVFVLWMSGDDLTPQATSYITHINSAGTVSAGYPLSLASGHNTGMVADGSGGAIVLYEMSYDYEGGTLGHGKVRRYTSAGLDGGFGTVTVSTNSSSDKSDAVIVEDGAGGAVVLWLDDESGEEGVYAQRITSAGAIAGGWSARGEQIVATTAYNTGYGMRAARDGSNIFFTYEDSSSVVRVGQTNLTPTSSWACIQPLGDVDDYDVVGGSSGVYAIWQDDSSGDKGVFAQHFADSTGHSTWSLGGELIDDADSNGGTDFKIVLKDYFSSTGDYGFTSYATAARPDGFGGVGLVYSYSTGSGEDIYDDAFDSTAFPAGPGGDCIPTKAPTKIYPDEAGARSQIAVLSAQYIHDTSPGYTNYRVSSSSLVDCTTGTNIVASGTSAISTTNNEPTTFTISPNLSDATYYWCAQNDDLTNQSAWTQMGSFVQNSAAPYVSYSTLLGGSSDDQADGIFFSGGTVFVVGETASSNFPTAGTPYDASKSSSTDLFVSGLTLNGSGSSDLTFSTFIGGSGADTENFFRKPIHVANNKIYIVGGTTSSDFPTTAGAFDTSYGGLNDGIIARFDITGSTLEYSSYFGGSQLDNPAGGVRVIGSDVYIVGATRSSDFVTTTGAYDETFNSPGFNDAFAMIMNLNGAGAADLVYSTYLGGNNQDNATFDLSSTGVFYISGTARSADFPTTVGAYDTVKGGTDDTYLSVINPAGGGSSDLLYSTFLGGTGNEIGYASAYDEANDVFYSVGYTVGSGFPTTAGAYDTTFGGGGVDVYITGINPGGNGASDLIYSSFLGGSAADTPQNVTFDGTSLFITGWTAGGSFPTTATAYGTEQPTSNNDAFVVKFTPAGAGSSDLVYSSLFGDLTTDDRGLGVFLDGTDLYVSGLTESPNFFTFTGSGTAPYDTTYNNNEDTFILKIEFSPGGGGGGGSPAPDATPPQVFTQLVTPVPDGFTVLGPTAVQYDFTYSGTNQTGFRPFNVDGAVLSELQANDRSFDLDGIPHNTLVGGPSILAFNTIQESDSASWEDAITHIIPVTPKLISRNGIVELGVNEELNNLELGQSGVQFELMIPETILSSASLQLSEWSQSGATSFVDVPEDQEVQVRARARNQEGIETEWSQYLTIPAVVQDQPAPEEETKEVEPEPEPEIPVEEIEEAPGDEEEPEPLPPPTEEETETIENVLTEIIEQEIEETTPEILPEPSSRIQTRSQSDGRSFTVEVEDTGNRRGLLISGLASTDQRRIEFTGTTSEPESVVTLIFNESVTVVVSSDTEGFWQTFVSAEQLGIPPGQPGDVTVEAIAAKDTLISDRVSVGAFRFEVTSDDEVVAEFESIVEEADLLTAINALLGEAGELIEEQEELIQTSLGVAAPVVLISSAPLWGYLPYLPTLIYHLISYLIGLIGRRKQDEDHLFGQVYDSITKKPLGLAVLRIYNQATQKLVATKVTDKNGRYDLLLAPGNYRIELKKPQYNFPSKIVTSAPDGDHVMIYNVDTGIISAEGSITVPDIPIDPVDAKKQWTLANVFKKLWLSMQKAGHYLAVPVLFVGAVASSATVATVPESPENWILAALYIFMFLLQLRLRTKLERAWGVVYDLATSMALPLTTIQLIDPEYGKVVSSRLTDYQGRFAFLPEPGSYLVKASKPGYEQAEVVESPDKDHAPMSGEIQVQKEGERIDGDIAMTKL